MDDAKVRQMMQDAHEQAVGYVAPRRSNWPLALFLGLLLGIVIIKSLPDASEPYRWGEAALNMIADNSRGCVASGRAAALVTVDGGCPACPVGELFRW